MAPHPSSHRRCFGDKRRFAALVGPTWGDSRQRCHVDLWAASRWLTYEDNRVFIPAFRPHVEATIDWLRSGCDLSPPLAGLSPAETHRRLLATDDAARERFWFPHWGPTTDHLLGHLFRLGDRLAFAFEFAPAPHPVPQGCGDVFVAELPEAELVQVLEQLLAALGGGE